VKVPRLPLQDTNGRWPSTTPHAPLVTAHSIVRPGDAVAERCFATLMAEHIDHYSQSIGEDTPLAGEGRRYL